MERSSPLSPDEAASRLRARFGADVVDATDQHGHTVVTVTRENIVDTVVRDGLAGYDEVYRGVPEARRPPRP